MPITHEFNSPGTQSTNPRLVSKNEWEAAHVGVLETPILVKDAAYTILVGDLGGFGLMLIGDTSVNPAFTVLLPLAASVVPGTMIYAARHGSDTVTLSRSGADTIYTYEDVGPANTYDLTNDGSDVQLISDGVSSWEVFF